VKEKKKKDQERGWEKPDLGGTGRQRGKVHPPSQKGQTDTLPDAHHGGKKRFQAPISSRERQGKRTITRAALQERSKLPRQGEQKQMPWSRAKRERRRAKLEEEYRVGRREKGGGKSIQLFIETEGVKT